VTRDEAASGGVKIRVARDEDIEELAGLLGRLFTIEADFAPDAVKQTAGLRLLLARPDALVAVAEAGGRAVGMCSVQTLVSTAEGGPVGLLEDLVVREESRGRGIGTLLLQAAERWARDRGLVRLQLLADRTNAPALGFYGARGWGGTLLVALRRRAFPQGPTG
jgi:GNAT superfamily N-acetyltransferase